MRRPAHPRRWLLGALAAIGIVALALVVVPSGGPLDSADDDGYLGLRLLLTERGASVTEIDGDEVTKDTVDDFDVVFVMTPGGVDRTQLGEWHQYVAAGGRLVLGQPDTDRPVDAEAPAPAAVVGPGTCDIEGGAVLTSIHADGVEPHHVHSNELSCFGNGTAALVTSAVCRAGVQYTLATPALFSNSTMGAPTDLRNSAEMRGNARLAAVVFDADDEPRIGIVTGGVKPGFGATSGGAPNEPTCGDGLDDDPLWQAPGTLDDGAATGGEGSSNSPDRSGGTGGDLPEGPDSGGTGGGGTVPGSTPGRSTGEEGTPGGGEGAGQSDGQGSDGGSGSGDQGDGSSGAGTAEPPPTLFDFLSPGVKLALAQLLVVLLWFAWQRSRRDGVVVEDHAPVQLRSSRLVEAVAALRRRGGETERAGEELRDHTRRQIATSFGLPAGSSAIEIAQAVAAAPGDGRPMPSQQELVGLLGGRPVTTEDALVTLAARLQALRDRLSPAVTSSPTAGGAGSADFGG